MDSLSWKRYDDTHNLSDILTVAARSCVDARAPRPTEYLAAYFTRSCTGDGIRSITAHPHFIPSGEPAMRVSLCLLNGTTSEVYAAPIPAMRLDDEESAASEADSVADEAPDHFSTARAVLRRRLAPRLIACGAGDQRGVDAALAAPISEETGEAPGRALAFALSAAAAMAAARAARVPPPEHIRRALSLPAAPLALPQLCVSFFGPPPGAARVAVRDVLVLPLPAHGALRRAAVERLVAAFRHFARAHSCPPRADGSLAFDGFESFADAVAVAEAALRAVGFRPGEDVCVGLRLDAAATRRDGDTVYALFPGDAEVTGAQLAEYAREQLVPRAGFVAYIEDAHAAGDGGGWRRAMAQLAPSMTVSGRSLYADGAAAVAEGLREMWSTNFVVRPFAVGSLSEMGDLARRVREHEGRYISLAAETEELNPDALAALAVGIEARFLCIGGLLNASQCNVLSHLLCMQDELERNRTLRQDTPKMVTGELPELPTDIVPEIKRRMEKKKRKK